MRIWHGLMALALLAGCTPALRAGDRAFEAGRYQEASSAWERQDKADPDARLYRRALLLLLPESPYFDREEGLRVLEALRAAHPSSVYGVAAGRALELVRHCRALEERAGGLQVETARLTEQVAAQQTDLKKMEEERQAAVEQIDQLKHEVHRLAEELQQLRDEKARLEEELKAMKRIDLRR